MTDSGKNKIPQDTFLIGIGASPGIGIGQTHSVNRERIRAVERPISAEEIPYEVSLFLEAVQVSKNQLEEVKAAVADRQVAEHLYIIDTHLMILEDQLLIEDTLNLIRNDQINAQGALKRTLRRFREVFDRIEDEYLRERGSDIDAIGERLLRNLLGEGQQAISGLDRKVVVVAHDLSPADTMQMEKEKIIGFMTDVGGRTSHTAILARSLGIPAVIGLENVSALVKEPTPVIIDGSHGTVILNPSDETFREYLKKKQSYDYLEKELLAYRELPSETRDGEHVALRGNVELPDEVPQVLAQGGEGIGLFRSEFLFLNRRVPPGEEEQFAVYREILEKMSPHPVTIRTLDVGGDKFVPEINLADEANPAMGLRAIRFSLKERRLFHTQLRAILRASAFGPARIMFPMISGVGELRACRECLEDARAELVREGVAFAEELPIGIMIETPSAALIADKLAREADFFSIGTNDLIQYCLAVDRGNEHVAYLYEPMHPGVLRALQMICQAAGQEGIPVSMCGEMAGDPLYLLVLLGLGIDEFSMNAPCLPRVKRILRQVTREEGRLLLGQLADLPTAQDVSRFLEEEMGRRFPNVFSPLPI